MKKTTKQKETIVRQFATKDEADNYSESLKHLWPKGQGQVYGPYLDDKTFKKYYEVR